MHNQREIKTPRKAILALINKFPVHNVIHKLTWIFLLNLFFKNKGTRKQILADIRSSELRRKST